MKRFLKFVSCVGIVLSFMGCMKDDDNNVTDFRYALVKIDSVVTPDTLRLGVQHDFEVIYSSPGSCYDFARFDFELEAQEAKVAVVNTVFEDGSECDTIEQNDVRRSFSFTPQQQKPYTFKFWQGENDEGAIDYLTIEIPVK